MTVKRRVFKQYYGYVDSKNCPVNVANKHIYGAVHHEFIANEGIKNLLVTLMGSIQLNGLVPNWA